MKFKEETKLYKFVEINSSEIDKFNESDRKGHIFQTSYWAKLKKDWKKKFKQDMIMIIIWLSQLLYF